MVDRVATGRLSVSNGRFQIAIFRFSSPAFSLRFQFVEHVALSGVHGG